ncbi:hypothetical protein GE09DRAFT_1244860 [Coniochaeta sp. 2T2.1]|nr:hypothetical protein GE09DRAFT_1244860 [Coniochaeta sp. 2T2.1]
MLFLLAVPALLATTVVAAPAFQVHDVLGPRQETCPTTSRWSSYSYTTTYLATTTVVNTESRLESVTATTTTTQSRTDTRVATAISPAVTSIPATTLSTAIATVTTTQTWDPLTSYVRLPGYAPSSECVKKTLTSYYPGTTSVTVTSSLLYATSWFTTIGHVSTVTRSSVDTTTRTTTTPGSTTYGTIVTQPYTVTQLAVIIPTVTTTLYDQGCATWLCG